VNAYDKVNILLVDDQPAKLLTYQATLEELGENLIQASSAKEALEQLLKKDMAVVLMDVCMPELDGFELAEIIRQHPRYQKTAIIFVSAVQTSDLGENLIKAASGREAIALLESTSDVAIVLMDIMMPEMDGYQTMEVIRKKAEFRRLPIIALTAKAMKGDREKCLEAGASDYLAKPVNTEQLLSALRMWLHR